MGDGAVFKGTLSLGQRLLQRVPSLGAGCPAWLSAVCCLASIVIVSRLNYDLCLFQPRIWGGPILCVHLYENPVWVQMMNLFGKPEEGTSPHAKKM